MIFFFFRSEGKINSLLGKWKNTETPGTCKQGAHALLPSLASSQLFPRSRNAVHTSLPQITAYSPRMSCHGSSWSRRDVSSWVYYRQDTSRGSPPSTSFPSMKDEKADLVIRSHSGPRSRHQREERPQPGRRCSLASSSVLTQQPRSQEADSEREGVEGFLCNQPSLQQQTPAAAHPRPDALLAPTVCICSSGSKPATQRGRTSRAAGFPRSTIPRRRFHTAFIQTPEDADSAERLLHSQCDPKLQGRNWPQF